VDQRTSETTKSNKFGPTQTISTQQIDLEDDGTYESAVLFINEESLGKSPQITVQFGENLKAIAVLDSGSEINLISQELFDKLMECKENLLTLPVQGVHLVTAFGRRSEKIKLQVLLEFHIDSDVFEAVFLISP
jgi:hypothetical protein